MEAHKNQWQLYFRCDTQRKKQYKATLQLEHLKYLFTLKKLGKLQLFGPLTDGGRIHGILILFEF
jgi:hypothetical protein